MEVVRAAGGLHRFMNWPHPILTDSGGYQVFSLAKLRELRPDGIAFRSHLDGSALFLGPREAMAIQRDLASDIAMVLDECPPHPCTHEAAAASLELTLRWAARCREQPRAPGQLVFGIVQGSAYPDLRQRAARELPRLDFDGYAIGGVSVGEPEAAMYQVLDWTAHLLPADRPRYLMGVGTPPQLVEGVARGIDMFDCVLPTRVGRNGSAYTPDGMLQIKAGRFKDDFSPMQPGCPCYACTHFTRAYIRHLINSEEILGLRLVTLHNLTYYLGLMAELRRQITAGTFAQFRADFHRRYQPPRHEADADDAQ
jgi:queuine tRNA-ribosyltransferase